MIVTVDPGSNGTGYAIWNKEWKLITWGIVMSKSKEWDTKMRDIGRELRAIVIRYKVREGHIEEPKKFGGTTGNMVADRGDLVKLSIFVGYLDGYLGIKMNRVRIIDWKGTLPKEVIEKRVKRVFPKLDIKSHAVDAVGIGLYLRGERSFQ